MGNIPEGPAPPLEERTAVTASFEGAPVLRRKPIRQERQWIRIAGWDRGDDGEAVSLGDE
jgi:hypothetical protein